MNPGENEPRSREPLRPELPPEIRKAVVRYRRRIRVVRALGGAGITLLTVVLLFWVAVVLDGHLLLSQTMRISITSGIACICATSALVFLLAPLLRPIPSHRAARWIEASVPSLEERLITTLELAENGPAPGTSPRLVELLTRSTRERLSSVQVTRLVSSRPVRWLWVGTAALVLLLGYASLDFRGFGLLSRRFFHPTRDLLRPTRVGLEVLPGNVVVGIDDDFTTHAQLTRGSPERVTLRFRVPGGEWRSFAMKPVERNSYQYEFRRLRQSFEYQVLAGDFASSVHSVEVRARPRSKSFTVTYHFPAYTGLSPRTGSSPRGDLSAVSGTVAEVTVAVVGSPARARLIRSENGLEVSRPLSLEVDARGQALVKAEMKIEGSGTYQIELVDSDGISNRGGDAYPVHAEKDRPPRVGVLSPRTSEVLVEESSRLNLEFRARDDYGVVDLAVVAGETGNVKRFPIPGDGTSARLVEGSYLWDLISLSLQPGESLPFKILATDGLKQEGVSPEMVLRVPFLPDPPEGPGWLSGLRELDRALVSALHDWPGQGARLTPEEHATFVPTLARAEQLARSSEELLKELSRLRALSRIAEELGRGIPIPSVNRRSLPNLGNRLRDFCDREGVKLWREFLALSGSIRETVLREGTREPGTVESVDADRLSSAHGQSRERLSEIVGQFRAIYLAERLEAALERARGLLVLEKEMVSRAAALVATPPENGMERFWSGMARGQQGIRVEGTLLGADLRAIAGLSGSGDQSLDLLARSYLESAVPSLEAAQEAMEEMEAGALIGPLEASADAFRDVEASLEAELTRAGEAARTARRGLVSHRRIAEQLAALASEEEETNRILKEEGWFALPSVLERDALLRPKLLRVRSEIEAQAREVENAVRVDFESAGDIVLLRDIYLDLLEGSLTETAKRTEELKLARGSSAQENLDPLLPDPKLSDPKLHEEELQTILVERQRAAEIVAGLARAHSEVFPGILLGGEARRMDGVSDSHESVAWRLRSMPRDQLRSLRAQAGVERELAMTMAEIRTGLEDLEQRLDPASVKALEVSLEELSRAEKSSVQAAAACLAGQSEEALRLTFQAARQAEESARLLDGVRSSLPGLARARAWIRSQIGSLPDRVERLARQESAHAEGVEALRRQLERTGGLESNRTDQEILNPPMEEETLAATALDQEHLRHEAARLAVSVSREAGRLASPRVKDRAGGLGKDIEALHYLDLAAERIMDLGREEMLRAEVAIEKASLATRSGEQINFLARAEAEEQKAVDGLLLVVKSLRLLEGREAAERASAELEELLASLPPWEDEPVDLERLEKEARALLDGVLRATAILSGRLAGGVLREELIDHLRVGAENFQAALGAIQEGDGTRARGLVAEGKSHLQEAIALARRVRGEVDEALAASPPGEKQDEESKPESRELEEIYAELARIQALREKGGEIEAMIEELLREQAEEDLSRKLRELAEQEEDLAAQLEGHFLTTAQLVELVADLLSAGKEASRIGGAQRQLRKTVLSPGGELPENSALAAREKELVGQAEAMAAKVEAAGVTLTIHLPAVLKPFWEAESRLNPIVTGMRRAGNALATGRMDSAEEELGRSAHDLDVLVGLLVVARERALEEIAERESGEGPSMDLSQMGWEEAMRSLREAARELSRGQPRAAQALQQSALRSMASAAEALHARLNRRRLGLVDDGLPLLLDPTRYGGPGLSWEALLRGDEARAGGEELDGVEDSLFRSIDAIPEEYRELVRIYLRALWQAR